MKSKFIEYGGIKHIVITLNKEGLYVSHEINKLTSEQVLNVLDLPEDTEHPILESLVTNQNPGKYEYHLRKKQIPGFTKVLNVTVNNITGPQVVPNTAQLILGKGGRWVTKWGSPIMPYLTILDVVLEKAK